MASFSRGVPYSKTDAKWKRKSPALRQSENESKDSKVAPLDQNKAKKKKKLHFEEILILTSS